MEMKSLVVGILSALSACSVAYAADAQMNNPGSAQKSVISADAAQVVGTGAAGETNSATMDQNGRWQVQTPASTSTNSGTSTTVTTPSGTTVTTPGDATVTVPSGSAVTTPSNADVTIQDKP